MADNLLDKASILLTPTAYNDGSMLSVKPENGDGDFTFSRGSAATRVNAQGLVENVQIISSELVSNGDFSQGEQDWTLGIGWSVDQANSKAVATSSTSGQSVGQSSVASSLSNGSLAQVSFQVLDITQGSFGIYFSGTLVGSLNSVGTFNGTFIKGTETTFYIRALGTTSGSISNISVKEITDDTDLPRIDYTDGCGSWLLEPQSTNLYLNSETLSTQSNATSASTYTVSFYGTGTITFSGTHTGTLVGTGANDRVSATFTTTSGTLTSTVSGDCTKGQLENLSYATSYILTDAAIATRLADVANNSGNSTLINSTEGVLYAEIAALANDGTVRAIYISNGTASNRLWVEFDSVANRFETRYIVNGITSANFFHIVSEITNFNKIAFKWKENDFSLYVNGIEVANDTSGSVINADTLNRIDFHNQSSASVQNFYGKVKALAVYKEALTDAQLQSLTTI